MQKPFPRHVSHGVLALLLAVIAALPSPPAFSAARQQPAPAAAPSSARAVRVLFIGNSYTYANDLPGLVAQMFRAKGVPFAYQAVTVGGATLEKHWNDGAARDALRRGWVGADSRAAPWDFVVLQEQSVRPFRDREAMFRYGRLFGEEARRAGARVVLYMTWAAKADPTEQPRLEAAYEGLGREIGAVAVVPAGVAWKAAAARGFDLYGTDGRHPNARGTYLNACLFWRAFSGGRGAAGLPTRFTVEGKSAGGITETQAALLQRVAQETPLASALPAAGANR